MKLQYRYKLEGGLWSLPTIANPTAQQLQWPAGDGERAAWPPPAAALDALTAHIAILDVKGNIVATNLAWRKFATDNGPAASDGGVGDNYLRVCETATGEGAEYGARAAQGIREVIAGRRAEFLMEYPCHGPNEQRWFLLRATRVPGPGPVNLVTSHENVTERKLAQDQVRMLNGILQVAGRSARLGGWQWDVASPRVVWSDMVCALHDVPAGTSPSLEEAIAFYTPGYRSRIQAVVSACTRDGTPFDEELQIKTATQRRVWVRAIGEAVRDEAGVVVRIQGSFQDISDRKETELKYRRMAQRLTTTLESITDAFVTVDCAWQLTYMNAEAERLLKRTRQQLLGKNLWSEVPAFVEGPFEEGYRRAMRELVTVTMEQYCAPLERWLEVRLYPSDEGLAIYFRDVTGRRAAQAELAARMDDIERSNAELEQFAYVASHDLKEPLRSVASFAQLLEARHATADPATVREYTSFITEGVRRMDELIEGLLAFAQVTQGAGERALVPLDQLLDEALANLGEAIGEAGASVTRGPLPVLRVDALLVRQLLQNLVGNAVKFRGAAPPVVAITAERCGDAWCFSVRDNGIGVDPQYAERIFVLFQRLNSRESYRGNGIGLAVCKRIVEAHGGRIWLEPAAAGADFRFTLPVSGGPRQ